MCLPPMLLTPIRNQPREMALSPEEREGTVWEYGR